MLTLLSHFKLPASHGWFKTELLPLNEASYKQKMLTERLKNGNRAQQNTGQCQI